MICVALYWVDFNFELWVLNALRGLLLKRKHLKQYILYVLRLQFKNFSSYSRFYISKDIVSSYKYVFNKFLLSLVHGDTLCPGQRRKFLILK